MKIKDYFKQLKLEYPIAGRLNIGAYEIATYNGTLNKIELCEEIWCGLEDKYRDILKERNIPHIQNFGICCCFTAEPYFNPQNNNINYRYVLIIYFYITHEYFKKKGFYCQGSTKYYDDKPMKHEISPVNKSQKVLFDMTTEMNSLIVSFCENNLDI